MNARPVQVKNAVLLLCITLAIGASRIIFASMHSPMGIVTLLVTGSLIFFIWKGRSWARIVFLVLFVIRTPFSMSPQLTSIMPMLRSVQENPVWGALGILQWLMLVTALVFLFLKPSSDWFRAMQPVSTGVSYGAKYSCSRCEKTVTKDTYRCPGCGAILNGIKCMACNYIGPKDEFVRDACPKCGGMGKQL